VPVRRLPQAPAGVALLDLARRHQVKLALRSRKGESAVSTCRCCPAESP
jgi:hypothetical protein